MWNMIVIAQLLITSFLFTLSLIRIPASTNESFSWVDSFPRLASSPQCHLSSASAKVAKGTQPLHKRKSYQNSLLISTTSGNFLGFTNRSVTNNVDLWRGIPYAEPPIGTRRFRAPILAKPPLDDPSAIQAAYEFGNACPQQPTQFVPVPISEDCLSLNIYRPANTEKASAQLPVLLWVHGGGFTMGVSASADGSILVSSSVDLEKPIVFVSINYRLNTFGFLNTDELPLEDLQVGLKDQILSLEWLKKNIANFGGDPKKITIWGQSAGAISVALLVTYLPTPRDSSEELFRSAIMDSGSPTSHTVPKVGYYNQDGAPYDILLKLTGCSDDDSSLECLRNLPYDALLNATFAVTRTEPYPRQLTIWGPSYKRGSIIDRRPSERLSDNDFLNIPVLMGTNKDEGTLASYSGGFDFLKSNTNSDDYFISYMLNTSILDRTTVDQEVLNNVLKLYPDDPFVGSPFDTGNRTFGLPAIFKRLAAWYGDLHYQAPRRLWTKKTSSNQPTYVYYFDGPRNSTDPLYAGIPHSSELRLIFGDSNDTGLNKTEIEMNTKLALKMRNHYLNFVYHSKPDCLSIS
ncbi:Alpha/Beta hydrolase protein [Phakopsora pachyrhizi]|nr:Alpha/Beta hydrolase protein [Phakopsora pachyrhizi]